MKIEEILISNILSFEPTQNIQTDDPTLSFVTPQSNSGMYIIIGPNGSGKSNFAEVVNQVFRKFLFQSSNLNSELLDQVRQGRATQSSKNILTFTGPQPHQLLVPNYNFSSPKMEIRITLSINDDDRKNLDFLCQNQQEFDALLDSYSNVGILQPNVNRHSLQSIKSITLILTATSGSNQFQATIVQPTNELSFVLWYFQQFDLLQSKRCVTTTYQ